MGHYTFHPHLVFESLSYLVAFRLYLFLRRRFGDPLATPIRWVVVAAAVAGAALGSKLLYLLEDPALTLRNLHNPAYLMGGKTIVGALVFGLLAVELMKRYIGLHQSTGDLYAIPLALGIAIGRIGCFLTGLSDNTYGIPSSLPWAINFGDGIPRHPTQLYEVAFLLILIPFLYRKLTQIATAPIPMSGERLMSGQPPSAVLSGEARQPLPAPHIPSLPPLSRAHVQSGPTNPNQPTKPRPGDAFKLFLVSYLTFRLLCDFLKPYPRIFLGLGGIQWACLLTLVYYSPDIARWLSFSKERIA